VRINAPAATWLAVLAAIYAGAAHTAAQQPIVPVPFTPFGDGENSVVMSPLQYRVGTTRFVITVPAGFVTDFASTPRAIWAVLPPFGTYQLAAVVHDFLYWDQGCTREQADALLRAGMAESRVEPAKRDAIWQAVRRGGEAAWTQNATEKQAGLPRIIPADDLKVPALVVWRDFRAQLVQRGVRPAPKPATPPDYCDAAVFVPLP
jgi:hypothetical protein